MSSVIGQPVIDPNSSLEFEIPSHIASFLTAEFIVAAISMSLNALIIYFIIYKTPKELKDYRYFLFLISFFDFNFDLWVVYLQQPVVLLPLYGAIVTGPFKYLGTEYGGIASILIVQFIFVYCLYAVNLTFIFCYLCIYNTEWRQKFVTVHYQLLANGIGVLFAVIVPLISYRTRNEASRYIPLIYKYFPEYHGLDKTVIFVLGGSIPEAVAIVTLLSLTCGLNVTLASKIIKKLWSSQQRNSTYQMQLRLTACLLLQTFSPIILLACPVGVTIFFWYSRQGFESFKALGKIFVLLIALHPLVNAICTLTFVQPYRRLIIKDEWLNVIRSKLCGKRPVKTVQHNELGRLNTAPPLIETCRPTESNPVPGYVKDEEKEVQAITIDYRLKTGEGRPDSRRPSTGTGCGRSRPATGLTSLDDRNNIVYL